jgi:hypothetical protein
VSRSQSAGEMALFREMSRYIPLTPCGMVFLAAAVALLFWTYTCSVDHVVRVFAIGAVALILISILQVGVVALACRLALSVMPRQVPPLNKLSHSFDRTGFVLPVPSWLGVDIKWVEPVGATVELIGRVESVTFCRRGISERITRNIIVTDYFGVAFLVLSHNQARVVEVCPALVRPLSAWQAPVAASSGEEWAAQGKPEGDMLDIGEYRQGDSMKFILWKLTARHGGKRVYVRRPDTVQNQRVAYFFLVGPRDDEVAALVDYLLRDGHIGPGDLFRCSTDGDDASTESGVAARQRLMASGSTTVYSTASFTAFQDEAGRQRLNCVVFVPPDATNEEMLSFEDLRVPTNFVTTREGNACEAIRKHGLEINVIEMSDSGSMGGDKFA